MAQQLVREALDWINQTRPSLDNSVDELWSRLKTVDEITLEDSTDTACLEEKSNKSSIKLNPEFIAQFVRVEPPVINMALVLLHEASHAWRRDLHAKPRQCPNGLWNSIADLSLHQDLFSWGFPTTESLTRHLYQVASFNGFLMPPHQMIPVLGEIYNEPADDLPAWDHQASCSEAEFTRFFYWLVDRLDPLWRNHFPWQNPTNPAVDELVQLYLRAWDGRIDDWNLSRRLQKYIENQFRPVLIGSHSSSHRGDGPTSQDATGKREAVRRSRFVNQLRKALVRSAESSQPVRQSIESRTVKPSPARRASFLMSRGSWPVFFDTETQQRRRNNRAAHVYLDSSGSMPREIVNFISSLLVGCADLVAKPVHLFCRSVEDVTVNQLRDGYRLTGGTRIRPVLQHAQQNQLDRFIVITDGHVEELETAHQSYLSNNDLFVLFTGEATEPLTNHAAQYWTDLESELDNS